MTGDRSVAAGPRPRKVGKYEIRDLLGTGSMGMVFLARDPILERDVAIKVMSGSSLNDTAMRERFEVEAKAVGQLHHPNIVTVHDLGYDAQGWPFIAMERLEGSNLEDLLEKSPPTLGRKLAIITQICRGLEHAHRAGIIHRDVKPSNIFVDRSGNAKIMDFGVARWAESKRTQAGFVVGTAGFISPEQLRGQSIDGRTDVFSLGVVLYELLTHRVLFASDSIERSFFQTLTKPVPVLVLPDGTEIPKLQRIVNRAVAKDATKRFPGAGAMADALESVMASLGPLLNETKPFDAIAVDRSDLSHEREVSSRHGLDRSSGACIGNIPRPTKRIELPAMVSPARQSARLPTARPAPKPPRGGSARAARRPLLAALVAGIAASVTVGALTYYFWIHLLDGPGSLRRAPVANASSLASQTAEPSAVHVPPPQAPQPPVSAPPAPATTPEDTEHPSESEVNHLYRAVLAALGNDALDEAASLIDSGEQLSPEDVRWNELRDRLRASKAELQWHAVAVEQVRDGDRLLASGSYQAAIAAYKKAMEYDPDNANARKRLDQAIHLKQESERARQRPRVAPTRRFVEGETTYMAATSDSDQSSGFVLEEKLGIKETRDAFFPAKVLIEVEPPDARAGERYTIRVAVFNEGYRPIDVAGIELITELAGRTIGRGQQISPRRRQVAPQSTEVVHEVKATWKEEQNDGAIQVTITLEDGSKLAKSLRW